MVSIIDTPRNRQDNNPTQDSSLTSLEGLNVTNTNNRSDLVAPKSGLFQRNLDRTTENADTFRRQAENVGDYIGGDGLIGRGIKQAGNTLADIPVNVVQTVVDVDQSIRTGINNTA